MQDCWMIHGGGHTNKRASEMSSSQVMSLDTVSVGSSQFDGRVYYRLSFKNSGAAVTIAGIYLCYGWMCQDKTGFVSALFWTLNVKPMHTRRSTCMWLETRMHLTDWTHTHARTCKDCEFDAIVLNCCRSASTATRCVRYDNCDSK